MFEQKTVLYYPGICVWKFENSIIKICVADIFREKQVVVQHWETYMPLGKKWPLLKWLRLTFGLNFTNFQANAQYFECNAE